MDQVTLKNGLIFVLYQRLSSVSLGEFTLIVYLTYLMQQIQRYKHVFERYHSGQAGHDHVTL